MLLSRFRDRQTAMRSLPAVKKINAFLYRPAYLFSAMLLTAVCNMAAWEWLLYPVFVLTAVYICLLGDDLLPLMPLVLFSYLAPSRQNNPGAFEESFFSRFGWLMILLAVLLLLALSLRILTDPRRGGKVFLNRKRPLLGGLLLLSMCFAIGGIGTQSFGIKSVAFGLLQGAAFTVPYALFTGMVNWKRVRKDYFLWLAFAAGCLLLIELGWLYLDNHVITNYRPAANPAHRVVKIRRSRIFTGWGMYNNIGCMLAMMIPAAFYIGNKKGKKWLAAVLGTLLFIGVVFTCSRGSMVTGGAVWLVCALSLLGRVRDKKCRMRILICTVCFGLLAGVVFYRPLTALFRQVIQLGVDSSNRDWLYRNALELFLEHPVLGISFYPPEGFGWSWSKNAAFFNFFPPRWHNTFCQLIVTGGIFALLAYLLHRLQTVQLFLTKMSREKTFIGWSLLVLLGCSLLDCHLFNIGPTLFYSMALAFAECRCAKDA